MAMGGYGWLWVAMGGYGWLWVAMGGYGWLWVAMGGYGWLWVAMGGYGWLWVAMGGYGWLCNWKRRHGVFSVRLHGEAGSADQEGVARAQRELPSILNNFRLEDAFN